MRVVSNRWTSISVVLCAWTAIYAEPTWTTGPYTPAEWTPLAGENILRGLEAELTGTRYAEANRCTSDAPLALLTDGDVPGVTIDWTKVVGLKDNAVLVWTFDGPKTFDCLRISSRWADKGRDGISIAAVHVRFSESSDWTPLAVPTVSYMVESGSTVTLGTGASQATLMDSDGHLAVGITALKLVFGVQDNGGAGYAEIEALGTEATIIPRVAATLAGGEATTASIRAELPWPGLGTQDANLICSFGPANTTTRETRLVPTVGEGRSVSWRFDGLSPATTYAYSVVASNALGHVSDAATGTFTTLASDAAPVRVNELLASGDVDWFEIHNPNPLPVDLANWLVTDDPTKKTSKWKVLPEGTSVPAGGHLVIFADGITAYTSGSVHVDLGFSAAGESIALARPDGTIVSQFDFPEQLDDISYGFDDSGTLRYFVTPTPGTANGAGADGPTPEIVFGEPHGYKTAAFDLTMACPDLPDAPIHYTTDGTVPTAASARYTAPLRMTSTTVVRAVAVNPASVLQRESVATYIFLDDVLAEAPSTDSPGGGFPADKAVNNQAMKYGLRTDLLADATARTRILRGFTNTIATVSLVIDPANLFDATTGIYVNVTQRGTEWERYGMVEQIDPVHGATNEFSAPMGLRIRGAASRQAGYPKHSFRVFFRGEYGRKTLHFPFFGDEGTTSFRRMDLRCSQNYSWANAPTESWGWMRDAFVTETWERDAQRDLGQPYTRSRYVNLFINGRYWGLYQTQERADEHFAESYLGGDSDAYDVYNVNDLNAGTDDGRRALYEMATAGFVDDADYLRAQGLNPDRTRNPDYPVYVDVTNLIVRTLIGHYAADGDSPCSIWSQRPNNGFSLRDRTGNSTGFKWFCHDGEHGLGMGARYAETKVNLDATATGDPVTWGLYSGLGNFNSHWLNYQLMSNAEYRIAWADLVHRHLFGNGALGTAANLARFRARMAEIDDAIVCEAARWGRNGQTWATWTNACEYIISNFIEQRFEPLIAHYRSAGWYPSVDAPEATHAEDGSTVTLSMPTNAAAVYYTTDGSDPRLWGGGTNAASFVYGEPIPVARSGLVVRARAVTASGEWSALTEDTAQGYKPLWIVASNAVDHVFVAWGEVPATTRLQMVWGDEDLGSDRSAWPSFVDLGMIPPGAGAMRVAMPAGVDFSGKTLRFFLGDETVVTTLASISANGTQQLDLGYVFNAATTCRMRFRVTGGSGGTFLGTEKGDDVHDCRFFVSGSTTYLDYPSGNATGRLSGSAVVVGATIYNYEFGNYYLRDLSSNTTLLNGNPVMFPADYDWPTLLFSAKSYGYLYALSFHEGESLVRDYVPARNGAGIVGLYDRITETFIEPTTGVLAGGAETGAETNRMGVVASDAIEPQAVTWTGGDNIPLSGDVAGRLRVAEIMNVPVIGGTDGAEYIVLTNLNAETGLHVGGTRITCRKTGDDVAKCDFTLPWGMEVPAGGTLVCTKEAFWPSGKITDGNVDVSVVDIWGDVVQRLRISTKWDGNEFRMCDGKGASFVATAFGREVLDAAEWHPSIPDIDDKGTRRAVAEAIETTPALQDWLKAIAAQTAGSAAISAYRGDATTLTACYLVDMLPEINPEITLSIPTFEFNNNGQLVIDGELRLHGIPSERTVNGMIRLLHGPILNAPCTTNDLGQAFPIPASLRTLPRPESSSSFYRLRIEPR